MTRHTLPALFLPLACVLICGQSRADDLAAKMDQYMQVSSRVDHFMGSVLVAQHGRIILSKGYGMADLKLGIRNAPDTEFRIGSITKEFTATAILELVARGKINVQDPVCKYIPNCPAAWRPIKIFNLLTHTSGIPDFTSFPNYLLIERQPITPSGLLALFENKPLNFKPGAKFSYSNSGYEVLGYIIERLSGDTYQEFLQRNIFGPLGMRDSGYDLSHPVAKNHAVGYFYTPSGYQPVHFVNMTVPFSAGALYSTVLDLYQWDRAVHAGKLLPKALLHQMLSPQVSVGGSLGGSHGAHYGFGWFVSTEFGRREISHEGGIEGFTSLNSWFPDDDAYVIVLDNVQSPAIFKVGDSLTAILFGQKYEIPKEYRPIKLAPETLQKFVGQYQLAPRFILTVRQQGDQLIAQATGQGSLPIFPASQTEFFFKLVDAQLTFVEDSQGRVTGLVLHQNGRDRPAKRISATVPPPPKALSLPVDVLKKYVGTYQLTPYFSLAVRLSGGHLVMQGTNQPSAPIYPKSQTEFFLTVVDATISFVENPRHEVTGLVLHQGGRDLPAKKIK
ncbi:MAG: serine hydrolase [Steroidobacteraceae bacterium]